GLDQSYQAWNAAPLDFWDDYREADQLAVHKGWKSEADKLVGDESLPEVQAMADELEIGLWARYVLEQHSHREILGRKITGESYDYVGDEIYERLAQLHVTTAARLPDHNPGAIVRNPPRAGDPLRAALP